jgi:hypothetical protein
MAQQSLDVPDVRTSFDQLCCCRMCQHVRSDVAIQASPVAAIVGRYAQRTARLIHEPELMPWTELVACRHVNPA